MIKIVRAFHGVRASGSDDVMRERQCDDVSGDPLCSYCPGDCVDDSINEVGVMLKQELGDTKSSLGGKLSKIHNNIEIHRNEWAQFL